MNGPRPPDFEQTFAEMRRRRFRTLAEAQGWLDRRVAAYNAAPQEGLGGLSPVQVGRLITGAWVTTGALRTESGVAPSELAGARYFEVARLLLRTARDEGPLAATATGDLSRRYVAALVGRIPGSAEVLEVVRGRSLKRFTIMTKQDPNKERPHAYSREASRLNV